MHSPNPALAPLLITSLLVLLTDQILKSMVLVLLDLDTRGILVVIPDHVRLVMAWNTGINFGLLNTAGGMIRWGLVATALAIVGLLLRQILRHPGTRGTGIAAGLLCGGALGNAIDRILHGAVVDYLNVSCCGITNPYVFNFADVAVFAGLFGLLYYWPKTA